jgi:hypothetical protein
MTLPFDSIVQDKDYDCVTCHINALGDYTVVFEHKKTAEKHTYANVKYEHLPKYLRKEEEDFHNDFEQRKKGLHLNDIVDDPNFRLIRHHKVCMRIIQ